MACFSVTVEVDRQHAMGLLMFIVVFQCCSEPNNHNRSIYIYHYISI